jgi:hypothetical protein
MKDFCVVVMSYLPNRLEGFLNQINAFQLGIDNDKVDIVFIHNLFNNKKVVNRLERTEEQICQVIDMLRNFEIDNKIVIERENVGEDMGAYHFAFNFLKHQYKYFFFINEVTQIHCNNWLKKFYDVYESNSKILATTPNICPGHRFQLCLPTTYWSIRSSFGMNMYWKKPMSRHDCERQEMEMVWPQVRITGGFVAQVGNGSNIMTYKNPVWGGEGLY